MRKRYNCTRCDDTGLKDYAGFGMDRCECTMPKQPFPLKDEWGMSAEDRRFLAWELDQEERRHRFKALKALWGHRGPKVWYSGCEGNSAGKGDDWTFWRALRMSLALILGRHWTQQHEDAFELRTGRYFRGSLDMCFWDNGPVYGGYTVMVGRLYPGLRCEMSYDGETCL